MAYKDKHGITDILDGEINNVSISRDTDMDFDSEVEFPVAVLLYTPSMRDTSTHYHIPFNVNQAEQLRDWLDQFVKEHKK